MSAPCRFIPRHLHNLQNFERLTQAMSEHDLVLGEQRISFRVHFPVHHWTGSGLRSPTYPIRDLKVLGMGSDKSVKSVVDIS